MTETDRLKALIERLESEGGSREASDEYLLLCCGWTTGEKSLADCLLSPRGNWLGVYDRPDPSRDAQDALDSLPRKPSCMVWDDVDNISSVPCPTYVEVHMGNDIIGECETEAAAICAANARMRLAELEDET